MAAFLKGRVSKLETRNRPSVRVRNTVLNIDALTGDVIGKTPKGPCMVVYHHGNDDEWEIQLQAQQARLIESAKTQKELGT
ncbi:MAG: hypothetical protein ACU0B7_07325 [Paracoccaceae bacterium]